MCLSIVDWHQKKGRLTPVRTRPCKVGYKVFKTYPAIGGLYNEHQGNGEPLPEGKLLWERNFRGNPSHNLLYSEDFLSPYPVGWHVFNNRKDAMWWLGKRHITTLFSRVIRRVQVINPKATGRQRGYNVTVCAGIKILPESRKRKRP